MYAGHIFLLNNIAKAFTKTISVVNGPPGTPQNHDISAFISSEITNISAVWCRLRMTLIGSSTTNLGQVQGIERFGFTFASLPAAELENIAIEAVDGESQFGKIDNTHTAFCIVPVTRDSNGVPNITEFLEFKIIGTINAPHSVSVDWFIMGFLA